MTKRRNIGIIRKYKRYKCSTVFLIVSKKCDLIPVFPYDKLVVQCPRPDDVDGGNLEYKNQFFVTKATYTADVDHTFENGATRQ